MTEDQRRMAREIDPDRAACYHRIRGVMKAGISAYYREFPQRLNDQRSKHAIDHSLRGLTRIFAVLDDYDIRLRQRDEP